MAEKLKRKKRGLQWTPPQKEIVRLHEQGKGFEDIVAAGYTNSMVSKVLRGVKGGQHPKDWVQPPPGEKPKTQPETKKEQPPVVPLGPPPGAFQTHYKIDSSQPISVGEIQVLPEDWRITQHGYFTILETFYQTKGELGYDGTIGQFMVDVFRFFRAFMRYAPLPDVGPGLIEVAPKEASNDGAETDNGG